MQTTKYAAPTPTPDPRSASPFPKQGDRYIRGDRPRERIGLVVGASMAMGVVAAFLFAAAPFIDADATEVGGAVLAGFALGWAILLILSSRFTDQPQLWTVTPAVLMGSTGALLVGSGEFVGQVHGWVLPPLFVTVAVWMAFQARRHLHSRTRQWVMYPVIAAMALAAVGAGYETVSEATDIDAAMPGRLVDVGGHRLHLNCTGTGRPTVVLQPGAGGMSSDMGWIAPAVARSTRVCVYDRAGRGWSEPASTPQDAAQIATDLHALLQRANVPGPYVMAGHSFGGLYVLTSTARYPDEVAGLVLIDTTQPATGAALAEESGRSASADSSSVASRLSALGSTTARLGLGRLFAHMGSSLPPQSSDEVNTSITTASSLRGVIDEYMAAGTSIEQAGALQDFGDKPLVVLTAEVGSDADKIRGHEELATFSTNAVHRIIDGADHGGLVAEKEHAAAVVRAILDVIVSVRTNGPLKQ